MTLQETKSDLWEAVAIATRFCYALEHTDEIGKEHFVTEMLSCLPRLFIIFTETVISGDEPEEYSFLASYVDENMYEAIRQRVAALIGSDDTYLETFEEDMKYSDTPIAASVSEGLADIFQDLYNFATNVRESEGETIETAFAQCQENFKMYWSQTLCNVMRPLNQISHCQE